MSATALTCEAAPTQAATTAPVAPARTRIALQGSEAANDFTEPRSSEFAANIAGNVAADIDGDDPPRRRCRRST
ncbi:hypothetical protein OV090_43945 [Nannocystis sp. RBIL2]|uniref:hypothetical protein n=1 Tax=Nannocystis sp. RBIL2 TaxID=2996788 RepID=UPI00227082CB|nr:hypothetical protein [Nannocystis sp. RBIL2]MCY1071778.1 hypothetical protein [Nannocystis sp. RBIL2]